MNSFSYLEDVFFDESLFGDELSKFSKELLFLTAVKDTKKSVIRTFSSITMLMNLDFS